MEQVREAPRGVVTLVFTDIQSYSEMSERYRGAFRPLLEQHNQLLRTLCEQYNGYEVKALGDAFFLAFGSAEEAVHFALEAQHAILNTPWQIARPDGTHETVALRIRIGIHTGEPEPIQHPDGSVDYVGPDVNRASRVCSAAHGGQILLSSATHVLIANALGDTVSLRNLGQYWLKGVGRERLWQLWQTGLPDTFPPPNTPRAELHNLTLAETPLIGRERELEELTTLLQRPNIPLLTLVGPSGVGKTRLAQAAAEAMLEQFADGVWFVPLDSLHTPEAMAQRIIQELPMQPRADINPVQQLVAYAQGRSMLLVLDGIEPPSSVAELARALIHGAAGVRLLVASLNPLQLRAEHLYEVKPLSVPPPSADRDPLLLERYGAVQLLLEGARRHEPNFQITPANAPAIAELCRQLDGLPLALELTAARLALLSPAEILKRLDERFQLLQTRSPDMPPRQRALQSAIEWSYCQLEPAIRDFFEQLGVFNGTFSIDDVEAVCESETPLDDLMELHQRAMLMEIPHKDGRRFRLLNPMRLFALSMLREKPERYAALRERHAHHFLRVAHAYLEQIRTPHENEVLHLAELQMDNLRAALEWWMQQGDWAHSAEMALCLSQLCDRLGWLLCASNSIQHALDASLFLSEEHAPLLAEITLQHAALLYERHEWELGLQSAQDALQRFEALGSLSGQARAHNLIGLLMVRTQRFDEALPHFQRALQGFMQANLPTYTALVMNNLGLLEYERGRLEEAKRFLTQAAQRQRTLGDMRGLSETVTNLGATHQQQGDLDTALRYYTESLTCEIQIGNRLGIARGLCNIGEVLTLKGEPLQAARHLLAAMQLFQQYGSPDYDYAHDLFEQLPMPDDRRTQLTDEAHNRTLEDLLEWARQATE
jgi:predicted ATPase/class 3 adenylate cyclase